MKVKLSEKDIEILNNHDTFELEDGTWEFASQFCGVHVYKTEQELMEWLKSCRLSEKVKKQKIEKDKKDKLKREKILKDFVTEDETHFKISKSKLKKLKEMECQNVGILYDIGRLIFK